MLNFYHLFLPQIALVHVGKCKSLNHRITPTIEASHAFTSSKEVLANMVQLACIRSGALPELLCDALIDAMVTTLRQVEDNSSQVFS